MGLSDGTWLLQAACAALFLPFAEAKLPFSSASVKEGLQQGPNGVTFDPLAVAAILHNPRANTSAAKLYTQHDRDLYRWPHTMMFGGTLIPLKLLVQHLTSRPSSLHPAISMCWDTAMKIPVRSTRAFPKELSVNTGNEWLKGVLGFDSATPEQEFSSDNDVLVAHVWDVFGEAVPHPASSALAIIAMTLIGWLTGFLIIVALVFSILVADIWAAVLFFTYLLHWAASVAVSYHPLVNIYQPSIRYRDGTITRAQTSNFARPPPNHATVPENSEPLYSIHERDEGGTIVFKGRRDTIEAWARIGWYFNRKNSNVHWLWISTGTLAAVASVACMVNMYGALQLGFLGVLIYSSLGEILATRIAGNLQQSHRRHASLFPVVHNATRTSAIIRTALEVEAAGSLAGLNWIDLTLLPPMKVFYNMQELLKQLSASIGDGEDDQTPEKVFAKLVEGTGKEANAAEQATLAERLRDEIWDAWEKRETLEGKDV